MVEDEEGVREVVGRMLERLGFHVITAVDGMAALRVLDEHDGGVTAVLLDLSMPRMGGRRRVRPSASARPDLPVVLMSGYTEQDVAPKILDGRAGAVGFLQKPFLSEDLSQRPSSHLPVGHRLNRAGHRTCNPGPRSISCGSGACAGLACVPC